ncbi:MAG: primosomal protein N' [Spirochaetes bacterium]|jgi:primosomal protein N' (replication factor Y)|nr:primosomal protein N' [Spirochaetota bacterium]
MSAITKYVDVYIGYPVEGSFTYAVPPEMDVVPGVRVRVNFKNRDVNAFVHRAHTEKPDFPRIKEIKRIIDEEPIFDSRLVDLALYTASNYISSEGEAMAMALPSGEKPSDRFRHPFKKKETATVQLSKEQDDIYNDILNSADTEGRYHLIYGITGSGKTEIYISLAREMIARGRSVIYLVPEITLSSQIFERLYNVFGEDLIVYHSHLTANQRLHSWKRFYSGDAKITVGTRSAIFLQCPRPGLIILDEEHDTSYKEHSTPRYHAKRLALYRCMKENAVLLLGSATPSTESLYAAEKGVLRLHSLKGRYGAAVLPDVEIIRINLKKGQGLLSSRLKLHTRKAIDDKRQVIFLLNRRGFAPILLCDSCGAVIECPSCSIGLNYHRDGSMHCHYCGYTRHVPDTCPACGSEDLVRLGSGTQKVEDVIKEELNNPRVFRMDSDSAKKKDTVYGLLEKMKQGDIDVLLGTQMVAKGFDFLNVSLVGVLLADIGLNLPDFRASERILSLLIQVAGRCGRGSTPGRVFIQTCNEDHYIFKYLKNHDYMGFYKHEQSIRRMLDYPPYSRLARLLVRGKSEERVIENINKLKTALDAALKKGDGRIKVLGPTAAPLSKIANNYRHHIILKSKDFEELKAVIRAVRDTVSGKDVYLEVDIDPYDML